MEPRRRAEQAMAAVVQEAYVQGVSTRRVDDLVKALGLEGVSKSQVSRLCSDLDAHVATFRHRPLTSRYPYVWLDATYLQVRVNGVSVSQAVVVAIGVTESGERQVLGFAVGPSEEGAFWEQFLRDLVARGLHGVAFVISDAHQGLRSAIAAVLHGASWQRCRVHWIRNVLASVGKGEQAMVAATIRTVFVQPDAAQTHDQWRRVADSLRMRYPKVAHRMDTTEEDVLAYTAFPAAHWRQIWSNNPLERLNKEIKRRTNVVGIFPTEGAVIRFVGMILAEQDDEWQVSRRYFRVEGLATIGPPGTALTETGSQGYTGL